MSANTLSSFDVASILLVLAALFGFVNYRVLKLPNTIGLLVIALAVSLAIVGADRFLGYDAPRRWSQDLLGTVDLPRTLLDCALSFLLFAGGLHVDLNELWDRKGTVLVLATVSVLLATGMFAAGIWGVFQLVGDPVPFSWCVVLGAVLAPTDPVAVAGLLRRVGLPPALQAVVAGESLFNDGVGVVVFTIALGVAMGGAGSLDATSAGALFLVQAVGGVVLGFVTGYIAFVMMRKVDEYNLELTISLALATATYTTAGVLGVSGPIAVVVAGLLIGNHAAQHAMSEITRQHLLTFWSLVDELLNALLFLLIGFEILSVQLGRDNLEAAAIAVPLALLVRFISVLVPTLVLRLRARNRSGALAVLTWGGLRGGISVALALTLPATPIRGSLLAVCYAIVVFTIVVQGLTMPAVIRRFYGADLGPSRH